MLEEVLRFLPKYCWAGVGEGVGEDISTIRIQIFHKFRFSPSNADSPHAHRQRREASVEHNWQPTSDPLQNLPLGDVRD